MREFLAGLIFRRSHLGVKRFWVVGVLIALVVIAATLVRPDGGVEASVKKLLDPDNFVRLRAALGAEPLDRMPVTIIDIDDSTFSEWNQPSETPRDKIFTLIEAAVRRRAALILIDVDLTFATRSGELQQVAEFLTNYAARGAQAPPLVLMRRLWHEPANAALHRPASVAVPTYGNSRSSEMAARLAEIESIAAVAPNLIWSSALHPISSDGVVRSWRFAEAVCNHGGGKSPRAFLAPAVVARELLAAQDDTARAGVVSRLKTDAASFSDEYCARSGRPTGTASSTLRAPRGSLPIPFTYWRDAFGAASAGEGVDFSGWVVPAVQLLSAREVVAADDGLPAASRHLSFCGDRAAVAPGGTLLSCDAMRDRAVLIGASHVDARDNHLTPLGPMPGIDVLANTLMSARSVEAYSNSWLRPADVWSVALFLTAALIAWRLATPAATIAIALVLVAFILTSGHVGVGAASSLEAVTSSLVMLGMFLLTAAALKFGSTRWRLQRLHRLSAAKSKAEALGTHHEEHSPAPTTEAGGSRLRGQSSVIVALVLTALWQEITPVGARTAPRIVGTVERIDHWSGGVPRALIERAGAPERTLIPGEYIYDGDRLRAPAADTTIVVARQRGPLTICPLRARQEDCVALIDGKGGFLQSAARFAASLDKIVGWYGSSLTANLVTRSANPPRVKLGAGMPQKIAAGERALWLAWSGGEAPWLTRVSQPGGGISELRSRQPSATLPSLRLRTGPAVVEIIDVRGRAVRLEIEVTALPPLPDFAGMAPTPLHARYLAAGWLAMQEDGAWVIEAATRLNEITQEYPAARALQSGLAAGEKVRP